jgi:outer membrane protein assembly factor BamD (BamD/ComL family)
VRERDDERPVDGPPPARSGAPGGDRGTFRDELALVSTARTSLEAGDVATCVNALERYDERFRAGIFAQEIEVLHIEALAASGARAHARTRAEKFLALNATSPYAERVRSVVERTTK